MAQEAALTDVRGLYRGALDGFGARVHAVGDEQWDLPSPCRDWNVRELVAHVVTENLWAVPLLAGATIQQVGDRFDGDVLGGAPQRAWDDAAAAAEAAVRAVNSLDDIVHLSFGDVPAREYLFQVFADHLVHGWDLARATAGDERLDDDLVAACAQWFAAREEAYRAAGAIGPALPVPDGTDSQTALLARFGRAA